MCRGRAAHVLGRKTTWISLRLTKYTLSREIVWKKPHQFYLLLLKKPVSSVVVDRGEVRKSDRVSAGREVVPIA